MLVIIRLGARASRVSGEMHKACLVVSVFSLAYAVQKLFGLEPPEPLLLVKRSLATLFRFNRYLVACGIGELSCFG